MTTSTLSETEKKIKITTRKLSYPLYRLARSVKDNQTGQEIKKVADLVAERKLSLGRVPEELGKLMRKGKKGNKSRSQDAILVATHTAALMAVRTFGLGIHTGNLSVRKLVPATERYTLAVDLFADTYQSIAIGFGGER